TSALLYHNSQAEIFALKNTPVPNLEVVVKIPAVCALALAHWRVAYRSFNEALELMRRTHRFLFAVASLLLGFLAVQPAAAQPGRQVYAYYFGWYTNDSWNDGSLIDPPATFYSSFDANAVGHQVDQARGAGIDAFIMDWYGP